MCNCVLPGLCSVHFAFAPRLHVFVGFGRFLSHPCCGISGESCWCVYICASPVCRTCVNVWTTEHGAEVRGRKGDGMHVSGLLTTLKTRALTDCPPSRHDRRTGKTTFYLTLECIFLLFSLSLSQHFSVISKVQFYRHSRAGVWNVAIKVRLVVLGGVHISPVLTCPL